MASALFYETIIKLCQERYGAKNDEDFPKIILLNYPFSPMCSRSDYLSNNQQIKSEVTCSFQNLQDCGAKTVAIACNTLHNFIDKKSWSFDFINIVQAVLNSAKKANTNKLLFLGTITSVENRLYEQSDISILYPSAQAQARIDAIIDCMLAGASKKNKSQELCELISELSTKGLEFDGVILGCTELSLLYKPLKKLWPGLIFDSNRLLALEVIKSARGEL